MAKSIMDYIFKWLATKFLDRESQAHAGVILRDDAARPSRAAPKPPPNVTAPAATDVSFVDKRRVAVNAQPPDRLHRRPQGRRRPEHRRAAPRSATSRTRRHARDCGSIMVRNGACYKCLNCGSRRAGARSLLIN